jgi:glycosyltransferase involved in cell wall biosynthesis
MSTSYKRENGISISVCVPAFNEEGGLEGAVKDLLSSLSPRVKDLEVIVVDDGSDDSTLRVARDLAKRHREVKVICHEKNMGIGVSYREALDAATGEYFTWFPGDCENSAEELVGCLRHLDGHALVTCHHPDDPRPWQRRLLSRLYTRLLNGLCALNLKYYNGLTIFPTETLRSARLVSSGFSVFAEGVIFAARKGYRVIELAAPLGRREAGKSKGLSLSSFAKMVLDVFRILNKR